jgi:hypothetical protein
VSTLRLSFATADVGKIQEGVGRLGRFGESGLCGMPDKRRLAAVEKTKE